MKVYSKFYTDGVWKKSKSNAFFVFKNLEKKKN